MHLRDFDQWVVFDERKLLLNGIPHTPSISLSTICMVLPASAFKFGSMQPCPVTAVYELPPRPSPNAPKQRPPEVHRRGRLPSHLFSIFLWHSFPSILQVALAATLLPSLVKNQLAFPFGQWDDSDVDVPLGYSHVAHSALPGVSRD